MSAWFYTIYDTPELRLAVVLVRVAVVLVRVPAVFHVGPGQSLVIRVGAVLIPCY